MDEGNNVMITGAGYAAYPDVPAGGRRRWILVVGVIVLVLAVVGGAVFFWLNFGRGGEVPNLRAVFDQSAPVPVRDSAGKYRYVSAADGGAAFGGSFVAAERFYGDYAEAAVLDGAVNRYGVINRSGKMVAEAGEGAGAEAVEYMVDWDLWRVGTVFYDGKMNRVTAEGDVADYVGSGFVRVKAEGEEYYSRILDRAGKEVYKCASVPCTVAVGSDFNYNGEFYAAIQGADGVSVLVYLNDGSEVMRLEAGKYFISNGSNIFGVKVARGAIEKQFLAYGGQVKEEFAAGAQLNVYNGRNVVRVMVTGGDGVVVTSYYDVGNDAMVNEPDAAWRSVRQYPSSGLATYQCDSGMYGLMDGTEEVLGCVYGDIVFPPKHVFEYYSGVRGKDLVVLVGGEVQLYDVRSRAVLRSFGGSDVRFFEDSAFFVVGDAKIYNLEIADGDGLDIAGFSDLGCFGNYFVRDGATYGPALTEVGGAS